ncbi:hypothetical protein P3T27_007549 [Kitasatospora sp. MAA19]|uniref:hypothetical protein n=1 Tax=unclassified Kitasatospora TaxID=2633591 RepID=UPI002473D638|nr:hypothetical protein [Kitasatospora sp. MAA19]MDH6710798.1 hypothetical protein [Kitasatospora sp. MAA19]
MLRTFIETFKAIRARKRAAAATGGLKPYTVVLDWMPEAYQDYAVEVVHVRAATPLAAVWAAYLQAARAYASQVAEFQGLDGEELILAATQVFRRVCTFPGVQHATNSMDF